MHQPFKSRRPTPVIVADGSFSKKQKGLVGRCSPPRPPAKSAPPISRVFRRTRQETLAANRPHSVSFVKNSSPISSPHYNSSSQELYFNQCFHLLSRLGGGSFGEAFKVQSKEDGQLYAIKKSRECFRGDFDRKQKLEEVKKLEQIRGHPNCVRFYKAWEERQHLYIQTELCEMSLKDYAEKVQLISETEIWKILVDLLQGLSYLHDHGLVHMDIKPANLFLGRDGLYKIGDFGLVLELSREISDALEGDPKYMAPELMEGRFTKSADIFSLGVTILELACGIELPRGGDAWQQLRHAVWPSSITEGLSEDLVRLIKRMMDPDPIRRPTVEELLHLPKVKQMINSRKRVRLIAKARGFLSTIYAVIFQLLVFVSRIFKQRFGQVLIPESKSSRTKSLPPSDLDSTFPHSSDSSLSLEGQDSIFNHSSGDDATVGWLSGGSRSPLFAALNGTPVHGCRPVSESSPRVHRSLISPYPNHGDQTPSPLNTEEAFFPSTPLSEKPLKVKAGGRHNGSIGPRNLADSFEGAL